MTNRKFYVYEHWRPDTDSCFYVGKGHGRRAYKIDGRSKYHTRIVAKLARLGICAEIRLVADGLEEDRAFDIERERIAFWHSAGVRLSNLTAGGEGASGYKHDDASLKRMAENSRKRWADPIYRERASRAIAERSKDPIYLAKKSIQHKAKWQDDEYRKKVCVGVRAAWASEELRTEQAARHCGRKRPLETGRKISAALLGKPKTAEFRKRCSEWQTGRSLSESHKNSLKASSKIMWEDHAYRAKVLEARAESQALNRRQVICLNDQMRYPSMSAAALVYGVSVARISCVCNGIYGHKTAGKGLSFAFAEKA